MSKAKTEITQNDFGLLRPRAAAPEGREASGGEGALGLVRGQFQRPPVRSSLVTEPVIRIAGLADTPALAALRGAWTADQSGPADDQGFEARFRDWYERESARRVTWLAEVSGEPVGMMNLAVFERMPRPGRDPGAWGYLGNAFVLAAYRDQGIGSQLMRALLAYADDHGYLRVVLSPSERSVPFYQRFGFGGGQRPLGPAAPSVSVSGPGGQRRQLSPLYPAGGPSCGPMTGSNAAEYVANRRRHASGSPGRPASRSRQSSQPAALRAAELA